MDQSQTSNCPKGSNQEIFNWLQDVFTKNGKVEYSTDGGYSWVPFRTKYMQEDAARIFGMNNAGYLTRAIIPPNNVAKLLASLNLNQITSYKVNSVTKYVYLNQETNQYRFASFKERGNNPEEILVTAITQKIPLTLQVQNTNEVISRSEVDHPITRGHIYLLYDMTDLDFIGSSRDILSQHLKYQFDSKEWLVIQTPRSFDDETAAITGGEFCCTILSGKYFISTNASTWRKIGDRFLIRKERADIFIKKVLSHGGYASYESGQSIVVTNEQNILEEIMSIEDELKEAMKSEKPEELAMALFKSLEFRDKAVTQLQQLNETIKEARAKAVALVSGSSKS